jgi:hypothetical protein
MGFNPLPYLMWNHCIQIHTCNNHIFVASTAAPFAISTIPLCRFRANCIVSKHFRGIKASSSCVRSYLINDCSATQVSYCLGLATLNKAYNCLAGHGNPNIISCQKMGDSSMLMSCCPSLASSSYNRKLRNLHCCNKSSICFPTISCNSSNNCNVPCWMRVHCSHSLWHFPFRQTIGLGLGPGPGPGPGLDMGRVYLDRIGEMEKKSK